MDQKTLGAMAAGICFLMFVLFVVGAQQDGLTKNAKDAYLTESRALVAAEKAVAKDTERLHSLRREHEDILATAALRGNWDTAIEAAGRTIEGARSTFDNQAKPLEERNEREDSVKLLSVLQEVEELRGEAMTLGPILAHAEKVLDFVDHRDRYLSTAQAHALAVTEFDLAPIARKSSSAQLDWPDKKQDVETRTARLLEYPKRAAVLGEEIRALSDRAAAEMNPDRILASIEELRDMAEKTPAEAKRLDDLIEQLYTSYDRILNDMEIREGAEVEFYHQYRTIKVAHDEAPVESERWQKVTKSVYERHENDLGMTLKSKPKGLYDSEATQVTAPPGYQYVGNSHYGNWETRSDGSRFWVFYGQYALMQNLLWGGRSFYEPVSHRDWNTYRSHERTGRPYYGGSATKPKFGSKGSVTSSRYADSKYVKSGGYRNTKYKRSGGTYRGSRYSSRSSTNRSNRSRYSSSTNRRGYRSGGGSRSFGK